MKGCPNGHCTSLTAGLFLTTGELEAPAAQIDPDVPEAIPDRRSAGSVIQSMQQTLAKGFRTGDVCDCVVRRGRSVVEIRLPEHLATRPQLPTESSKSVNEGESN